VVPELDFKNSDRAQMSVIIDAGQVALNSLVY